MALFTEARLRARFQTQLIKRNIGSSANSLQEKVKMFVNESLQEQKRVFSAKTYDIFLSHSFSDSELILGLKMEMEDMQYSVYVDWIEDTQLNRNAVTKNTAHTLKERMRNCKSLFYASSENSTNSKWMPWELGYFDGLKGKVAILPIVKFNKTEFVGNEYLGIYNYVEMRPMMLNGSPTIVNALWIHENADNHVMFDKWVEDKKQ